jgi:hypothetical protein
MGASEQLRVRGNDELVLDAGTCEEVSGPHGPECLIRPLATTLFHQVLAYLKAKPDPPKLPSGSTVGREGVAAAALTLRWGSYLAAFAALAVPTMANRLVHAVDPERLARVRTDVAGHPSRVFATAMVNVAWRNGPVENMHAGSFQGYTITQRRVTPAEEKELMQPASDGLALGMTVRSVLAWERADPKDRRPAHDDGGSPGSSFSAGSCM